MKTFLILVVSAIGLLVAATAVMFVLKACPPQGPWLTPPWCRGSDYQIKIPKISVPSSQTTTSDFSTSSQPNLQTKPQTSQSVKTPSLLTAIKPAAPLTIDFTVQVPENTPNYTSVWIEFRHHEGGWGPLLRMEKKSAYTWEIALKDAPSKQYRYTRDEWSFTGAEEFSPDSKTAGRFIKEGERKFNDIVKKWRWMPAPGEEISQSIPTKAGQISFVPRINNKDFQKGVVIADFWWGNFHVLNSTHERLKKNNFKWLEVAPGWEYKQIDPLPVVERVGYKDEEINLHLKMMKRDGFKILLQPSLAGGGFDMGKAPLSPEWWDAWFERYEAFALYFADLANKNAVDALLITGDEIATNEKPANYQQRLEAIYSKVRQIYKGELGRGFVLGRTINQIDDLWPKVSDSILTTEWDFLAVRTGIGLTTKDDPTQEELYLNVKKVFDLRLKPFYEQYQKPIVLSQVGYVSVDGALTGKVSSDDPDAAMWEPYSDKYVLDLAEQAMAFEAFMKNIAETDYITGIYPFAYWPDDFPLSKENNVRGKPAEEVLSQWYESIK